jgi:hypothetical protein
MKLASETTAGLGVPLAPSLEALLARLEALSLEPGFATQRQIALGLAFQPYLEGTARGLLLPLVEETQLADLSLYADFYPQDGQLTLIEQLRDIITEHIPQEERDWLDPLKHSYMDLVEFISVDEVEKRFILRSIGDGRTYRVSDGEFRKALQSGQVLLTRMIREPGDVEWERAVIAGAAIVLSKEDGLALLGATAEYRRQVEITAGSFELGDWPEFAKRFGHVLLGTFARMRFVALLDAVGSIRYVTADGQPYLYGLALYDHNEYQYIGDGLTSLDGIKPVTAAYPNGEEPTLKLAHCYVQQGRFGTLDSAVVARLTLTVTQLLVECESRERLDAIKHQLAAAFGFSLHFRGESATPPLRQVTESQLATNEPLTVVVTPEEDRALLNSFFESVYLEWAERACPALGNQTPRHIMASADGREKITALIAEMERHDLGVRRVGHVAFDYNKLRAHVGLDEVIR